MRWFDSLRTRLRLLFHRRAAEARMHDEMRFHVEMEADQLMREKHLTPEQARRQALAAFGGMETHKEAMRAGRGLAWLGGLSLDLKLGARLLLKYPGVTLAGGLALAIAIGVGAGWYDISGKLLSPVVPLPDGNRIVLIDTHNTRTNAYEPRVLHDLLEWRRELRSFENLGAYHPDTRNLIVGRSAPAPVWMAEITADALRAARGTPLTGRALLESDEAPGAPAVVVIGYDVWQRSFSGRHDAVGSIVRLGDTEATVIGVMPEGFAFPINHQVWTPLSLRATYGPLEGGAVTIVGRLASGASREQANAELGVASARAASAFPASHEHLRASVRGLAEERDVPGLVQVALRNTPALLVLLVACLSVGTLIYARTATREREIAIRSALGAGRARIIGQLFVETCALALLAAAAGLFAADRAMRWVLATVVWQGGGAPFWITPGLRPSTTLYAGGLAIVSAAVLSMLPALKVTRVRLQPQLAKLGTGGGTLRFGRVWTGAMVVQVALTAIGMPLAMETVREARRTLDIRAAFSGRAHFAAARIDLDRSLGEDEAAAAMEQRRANAVTSLLERLAQEPGVEAAAFSDQVPGVGVRTRFGVVERESDTTPAFEGNFSLLAVGPGFFETYERTMVAGRAFQAGDWHPAARTVIVNEAFARRFRRATGSLPLGAYLRYRDSNTVSGTMSGSTMADGAFEIVGVTRDVGLSPDDAGEERPYVYHTASAATVSPVVVNLRVHDDPGTLAARLPTIAASVDSRLIVPQAQSLDAWLRPWEDHLSLAAGVWATVTTLVLFLSALSIFSLMSVSVSRQTREIGLRAALGAQPRHVLTRVLFRAIALMSGGIVAGGTLLLVIVGTHDLGDAALYARFLVATAGVMLTACLLACLIPARRALKLTPSDALRET